MEACATKNFTRVDNVFCSTGLIDMFMSCNTYPQWRPQKTDHMPIISVLEIEPERIIHTDKFNYKLMDWEEFRITLGESLAKLEAVEEILSEEQLHSKIVLLDGVIKEAVQKHVPLTRLSPYTKRWWNKDLAKLKRSKEKLARKLYLRRAVDNDPAHEEFRQTRNDYSKAIHDTKAEHWLEWLETLDEEGVWAANQMVTGPAMDWGRSRIPKLEVKDPVTK